MLDFFRSHQRLMQFLLLLLIIPAFVFLGVERDSLFSGNKQSVAEVDGKEISQKEFDFNLQRQEEQMRKMFGDQTLNLRAPQQRLAVLNKMVDDRVVLADVNRLRISISDQMLASIIPTLDGISELRKADGSIDLEAYRQVLASQGMTPEQFDVQVRLGVASDKLKQAISSTAIAAPSLVEKIVKFSEQEREVQSKIFRPADFVANLNPSEQELKASYDAKRASFSLPEEAKIEYLVFSAANLASTIDVTDAMLREAYQAKLARANQDEQRRASHILIAVGKNASAAERTAARTKAQTILTQLRLKPEQFADVAKKESNDPGSAAQGGDLGFFTRGSMVKSFEDAVYHLQEGQISDVVESDYGFHIIKLTGIKQAQHKSLEELRTELGSEVRQEMAIKKFNELAEGFSNLVYEQYTSLQPAATQFKLPILSAEHVMRQPNPALGKDALLNNPKLLEAIFSDDAIKNKRNTQAVTVAPQTLVVAHVVSYRPLTVRPFEEARAEVRERWVSETSTKMAMQAGEKMVANPAGLTDMSAPIWLSRNHADQLPQTALIEIFRADIQKLPKVVGIDLGSQGYAVYKITQARQSQPVLSADQLKAANASLAKAAGGIEYRAYLDALRARFKVKLSLPGAEKSADF